MWIDNTKFHRAVNQPVTTPALKQPTSIPNSEQIYTGPRPPPQGTRHSLKLSYYEDLTLKEIGLVLDELEPRVSRIHASAILHLRSELSDWGYR
jgi:DNA-directed RNA polymerase specialized sigma subunit